MVRRRTKRRSTRTRTVYVERREQHHHHDDFMGNAVNLMGGMMVLGMGAAMVSSITK